MVEEMMFFIFFIFYVLYLLGLSSLVIVLDINSFVSGGHTNC